MFLKKRGTAESLASNPVYKQLERRLYFPYYLAGPKVNHLYSQVWGDLQAYAISNSRELSIDLGVDAKSGSLVNFLSELTGNLGVAGKSGWDFESSYRVTDLAKFIVLRRFLLDTSRVTPLEQLTPAQRLQPHVFVHHRGSYNFHHSPEDASELTPDQQAEVTRRKRFEEKTEETGHLVLTLRVTPVAVLLMSRAFISEFGTRYLPMRASTRTVSVFAETIDECDGLQFLDPIAIGWDEKHGASN